MMLRVNVEIRQATADDVVDVAVLLGRPERAAAHRFYPAMGFEDANPHAARYWKWLDDDGFRR